MAQQSTEAELMAGTDSVAGGIAFRRPMYSGYTKIGFSGVYADDDDTKYQLGNARFVVGNDTLSQGLSIEAGLQGIFGSAEEDDNTGDVGAIAFTARVGYLFPRRLVPIPLEIFGGFTYAPEPLSFIDLDEYKEINLGVGVHIIPNASIQLSYHSYEMKMDEDDDGEWTVDDDSIRLGLVMRF